MIRHPTALELIDAVARFIEERAAPALKDRDAFHARVAVNALGVVRRELEAGAAAEAAFERCGGRSTRTVPPRPIERASSPERN